MFVSTLKLWLVQLFELWIALGQITCGLYHFCFILFCSPCISHSHKAMTMAAMSLNDKVLVICHGAFLNNDVKKVTVHN